MIADAVLRRVIATAADQPGDYRGPGATIPLTLSLGRATRTAWMTLDEHDLQAIYEARTYQRIKPGYVEASTYQDSGTFSCLMHQGRQRTRLVLSEKPARDLMNAIRRWLSVRKPAAEGKETAP